MIAITLSGCVWLLVVLNYTEAYASEMVSSLRGKPHYLCEARLAMRMKMFYYLHSKSITWGPLVIFYNCICDLIPEQTCHDV